jgi:hypothetical protein
MGVVNLVGPEWHSSRGGRIDQRIELDMRLARGGAVLSLQTAISARPAE